MKRNHRLSRVLCMTGLLVSALILLSVPFGAAANSPAEVVASGLDNPRGLALGPEGALYVAEAGRGGDGPCVVPGPFGPDHCYGPSGAITRIWHGKQERVATGLSSWATPAGDLAFGPHDISLLGRGTAYVVVGFCFLQPDDSCGRLLQVPANGNWRSVADIGAWEIANDPDGEHPGETNAYAALAYPDRRIVIDAAGNTLLQVAPNGDITLLALFPERMAFDPRSGTEVPIDAVPTSVAVGLDGAYYVGQLTGAPFIEGAARIYRVLPGQEPEVWATGFTNIIDIAFDHDGSLLVLEMDKDGLFYGVDQGALIRVSPDGSQRTELLSEGLTAPSAVLVGDDGAIYISNHGQEAGSGEVIRFWPDE